MFRFVNNLRFIFWFSTVTNGSAFIAIVAFGAPPVTLFFVACAGLAFLSIAKGRNERAERSRPRR
jgi:hypothetical protein